MKALSPDWWDHHRRRMSCWHHDDLHQVLQDLDIMQAEIEQLLAERSTRPTAGHITATTKDGTMSDTYAPGATIYLTAGDFTNAENQPLTGPVPGTWASDQGTITANPNNADEATLVNAPLGTVNVTFTADSGLVLTYQATIADQTPTAGTVTGSTTAPADEPAPAAA